MMKLESIRGFAAGYVVLHHAMISLIGRPPLPFALGQEAVILFFILSGFVIHQATCVSREWEPFRAYFLRRFRRIYPLFTFALVYSYAIACLGEQRLITFRFGEFAGNLMMLQDNARLKRGTWVGPFCHNMPLWSLSYEWWFYMMFYPVAVLMESRKTSQKYLVFVLSISNFFLYQAVPNQASLFLIYFPIWWCGVELSREFVRTKKITWRVQGPNLGMLATLSVLWLLPAYLTWRRGFLRSPGFEPLLQLRHTLAALAFLVIGIAWSKLRFIGFQWSLGPFRTIAAFSYALYVLHAPPLEQAMTHFRGWTRLTAVIVVILLTIPLAFLIEVRIQHIINLYTNKWIRCLLGTARVPKREDQPATIFHVSSEYARDSESPLKT